MYICIVIYLHMYRLLSRKLGLFDLYHTAMVFRQEIPGPHLEGFGFFKGFRKGIFKGFLKGFL